MRLFGLYSFSHQSCATGTLLLLKEIYPRKSITNLHRVIFYAYYTEKSIPLCSFGIDRNGIDRRGFFIDFKITEIMAIKLTLEKTQKSLFCESKWWGDPDMPADASYPMMKVCEIDRKSVV